MHGVFLRYLRAFAACRRESGSGLRHCDWRLFFWARDGLWLRGRRRGRARWRCLRFGHSDRVRLCGDQFNLNRHLAGRQFTFETLCQQAESNAVQQHGTCQRKHAPSGGMMGAMAFFLRGDLLRHSSPFCDQAGMARRKVTKAGAAACRRIAHRDTSQPPQAGLRADELSSSTRQIAFPRRYAVAAMICFNSLTVAGAAPD